MELQEIEITIDKNGKVQIHVHGVSGTACLELTRALEEALGGEVELRQMTAEAQQMDNPLDLTQRLNQG
ncbi:MAG: DUF2997 domain-containing protein [Longilinea sp.]|nr:DUF2997 domain-containing protein [Longilinea sp.]